MNAATLQQLTDLANRFRDDRDWRQFHNFKDMALSLNLEVSELCELMQWKNGNELNSHLIANRERVGEELSDITQPSGHVWRRRAKAALAVAVVEGFQRPVPGQIDIIKTKAGAVRILSAKHKAPAPESININHPITPKSVGQSAALYGHAPH